MRRQSNKAKKNNWIIDMYYNEDMMYESDDVILALCRSLHKNNLNEQIR